ncbi:MAG: EAL domain-containing protein [Acidaminococcaceae bacterium]
MEKSLSGGSIQQNLIAQYDRALRSIYDELFELDITDNTYKIIYHVEGKHVVPPSFGMLPTGVDTVANNMIYPADKERFLAFMDLETIREHFARGEDSLIGDFRKLREDGNYYWASLTLLPIKTNADKEIYLCFVMDIDDKVQWKKLQELNRLNKYDDLTGLYSKNTFYEKVRELLSQHHELKFVMMRLNIDRFKLVNDLFGLERGDQLLRFIGTLISKYFAQTSYTSYCRMDADIFAICLPFDDQVLQEVMSFFNKKLQMYDRTFEITPSFGFYLIEDPTLPVNLMCDRANLALQTIKGNYVKRYAFYDDVLRQNLVEEHEIISQMNFALRHEQFEVYLQPKYDLSTNDIIGAEALVRWNHPTRGFLSPDTFIPVFERNGFIMRLDAYVWEHACQLLRKWLDAGTTPPPLAVNISRINIYNPKLFWTLVKLVERYEIPPKLLSLELTESAYTTSPQQLATITKKLRNYGFAMHMDDFGSGYSSLNMLKDIEVDVLKIDLNFLSDTAENGKGGNILASVIRMAKWLNLPVIAEGVETQEQVAFLRSVGCTMAQGYFFAKPMPVPAYEKLLRATPTSTVSPEVKKIQELNLEELWNPGSCANLIFNSFFNAAGIYELHQDNIELLRVNDQYFHMTGCTRKTLNANGLHILDWVVAEDKAKVLSMYHEALNKGTAEGTYRRTRLDGGTVLLHTKLRFLAGDSTRALFYAYMLDITQKHQAELELKLQNERYRIIVECTNLMTFDYDVLTDTLDYAVQTQEGQLQKRHVPRYLQILKSGKSNIHPADVGQYSTIFAKPEQSPQEAHLEFRSTFLSPDYRWYRCYYVAIPNEDGTVYRVLGKLLDIQEEHELLERIHHKMDLDQMTGIYNKTAITRKLEETLATATAKETLGVIIVDLDNFKTLNDQYGHLYGDQVLREVATCLQKAFGHEALLGRFGGDEFMVLLPHTSQLLTDQQLQAFYTQLHATQEDKCLPATCSTGVAYSTGRTRDLTTLITQADRAMYRAKKAGKNQISYYQLKK